MIISLDSIKHQIELEFLLSLYKKTESPVIKSQLEDIAEKNFNLSKKNTLAKLANLKIQQEHFIIQTPNGKLSEAMDDIHIYDEIVKKVATALGAKVVDYPINDNTVDKINSIIYIKLTEKDDSFFGLPKKYKQIDDQAASNYHFIVAQNLTFLPSETQNWLVNAHDKNVNIHATIDDKGIQNLLPELKARFNLVQPSECYNGPVASLVQKVEHFRNATNPASKDDPSLNKNTL
jgi:hypothetical protein